MLITVCTYKYVDKSEPWEKKCCYFIAWN